MNALMGLVWIVRRQTSFQYALHGQHKQSLRGERALQPLLSLGVTFVLLVTGFAVTALAMLSVRSGGVSNPFLPYMEFDSTFTINDMREQGFNCVADLIETEDVYCTFRPAMGVLSEIYLIVKRGVIDSITFTLSNNAMTIGNLNVLWGESDSISFNGQSVNIYWVDRHITAHISTRGGNFNYFSPVLWVVFDYPTS